MKVTRTNTVTIEIAGQPYTISEDEARKLWSELNKFYGPAQIVFPSPPIPVIPQPEPFRRHLPEHPYDPWQDPRVVD